MHGKESCAWHARVREGVCVCVCVFKHAAGFLVVNYLMLSKQRKNTLSVIKKS